MATTSRADGLHLYLAAAPSTARHGLMALNTTPLEQPAKFLLSYHYFKKMDLDELVAGMNQKPMLFSDSGAYSAWTQGAEIKVKDYAAWVKRWSHLLDVYVNLDVVRDPQGTRKNQLEMERLGLNPIPVFHTGSPMSVLDDMCKEYPYIALGGMVGTGAATNLKWSATCMQRTAEYGTAFHGFGQTSAKVITTLPWYSVDSSSWGAGHRFGSVPLWTGREFVKLQIGNHAGVYKYAAQLRKLGVDPACLADRGRYHQRYAIQVAAASWHSYEALLRKRHGAIKCPNRPDGLHLYLVDGAKENLQNAAKAINK
jgi:hypothetical protein